MGLAPYNSGSLPAVRLISKRTTAPSCNLRCGHTIELGQGPARNNTFVGTSYVATTLKYILRFFDSMGSTE